MTLLTLPRLSLWTRIRCRWLGWHKAPQTFALAGISLRGICPRCHDIVLQDSQGNWFSVQRYP
jgi:hypothetical protein